MAAPFPGDGSRTLWKVADGSYNHRPQSKVEAYRYVQDAAERLAAGTRRGDMQFVTLYVDERTGLGWQQYDRVDLAAVDLSVPLEMTVRFWKKVNKTATCWLWTGSKSIRGYGRFRDRGQTKSAYRIAYELLRGPIPAGLELDHLCRNPPCCNPRHLEPVSHAENCRRGVRARRERGSNA